MTRRTPPAARRQRDPERSKEQILAAAVHEFAAKGYAGARVGAIAERAGVNKQLISYYFGGKEGLYRELGDRWLSREEESSERYEQLSLGELVGAYLSTDRDLTRLFLWEGLTADIEDPGSEQRTTRMTDAVGEVERRQRNGELHPDIDPRAFLLAFMGASLMPAGMPQLVRSIHGADTDPDSAEYRAWYADQLERIVRQLAAPRDQETEAPVERNADADERHRDR